MTPANITPMLGASATRAAASPRLPRTALCLALLTAAPGTSLAARLDYEVGAAVLHSDNIALIENDPIRETVLSPQVRFRLEQAGSTVQMLVRGDVAYLHYLDNSFDDEIRGELAGQLDWTVLPERMDLVFKNNLTRQPISQLVGLAPDNQQQVNVFTAGPSFYSRLGDSTRGQLDLRYSNSYAEETSDFNGDRYNVATRVLRDVSATTAFTVNAEVTKVEYDDVAETSDYTRYDGYFGYSRTLSDIDIGLALGYSWLDIRGTAGRSTTPLGRAELDWRLSPRSEINTALSYQFADATQDVIARAGQGDEPILGELSNTSVLIGASVFEQRQFEATYQFTGERFGLQLRPYYQRIRYLDDGGLDQDGLGGAFQISYRPRPRMTVSFLVARLDRDYVDLGREDQDTTLFVSLVDQITRHWSWQIDFQHRERDSDAIDQSYDENAIIFTVSYRR